MAKELTIIKECKEHTVLDRHTDFEPIIVAWCLDKGSMTWAQGHYFQNLEDAMNWLAWRYDEELNTKAKFKLHKTKSLKERNWDDQRIKYRWYHRIHTNEYGTWIDHVFTYDSTTPSDGWWDWECDSETEAQEWFDNYNG